MTYRKHHSKAIFHHQLSPMLISHPFCYLLATDNHYVLNNKSFIHSFYFYSAPSSPLLLEGLPSTATGRINHVANVSIETGLPRKVVILGAYLRLTLATLGVKRQKQSQLCVNVGCINSKIALFVVDD